MSNFLFKLDPASLPKLNTHSDNFPEYRSAWTVAFQYAGLWPIISRKKVRPRLAANADTIALAAYTEAVDAWDTDDTKALVIILSSVHNNLT